MGSWNKWLWGGLGWAFFGPIGGILGYAMGTMTQDFNAGELERTDTQPGDFGVVLLILAGAVIKADGKILKSELEFVKQFFVDQFGVDYTKERMQLFKEMLRQEYSMRDVCVQIKQNMDYDARVQLLHFLFGVSNADGEIHPREVAVIQAIARYMGIHITDYTSIKAMFYSDINAMYKILEVNPKASDEDVKQAYKEMAIRYHPDKVNHLGEEFEKAATEKFQKVNEAYENIKTQRGIK